MADNAAGGAPPSREQRFRDIMNAAAGASTADYQGYGRFWDMPLPQLRQFELYGIPMMRVGHAGPMPLSPPPAPSGASGDHCCPAPANAPAPGSAPGVSPGLIRGLRGQYPFDGTQFPPLPWGGSRVAESDIQFIEQWIADGCPEGGTDARHAHAHSAAERHALATGQKVHAASDKSINQLVDDADGVKVRKNIKHLSPDELRRFRAAIAKMKSLDNFFLDERSYAYWARIHANQCQHGWEEFLTWHRVYLYGFEKQLQDVDPTVTLPYWEWSADVDNVKTSIEDMASKPNLDNGYVPEAYQCWMDEDGLRKLADGGKVSQATLDGLRAKLGTTYSSGWRLFADAGITYGADKASDTAIKNVLAEINPLFHWRRWPGGNKDLIFEAYPTPGDVDHILDIENFFTFGSGPQANQFFGALENIHNLIHNFSGGANPYYNPTPPPPLVDDEPQVGDMVDSGFTAFDPLFWGHHANVDRLWAVWQRRNPGAGPDNPAAVLPPWNFTVADTYSIARLGYQYMMAAQVFKTDSTLALQHFRSAATPVHPDVLEGHSHAEIRLHAVQFVPRPGFYVRAFLNTPDAGINTPTKGNPNFVGQVNMFTGVCIGGPGHCDVPEPPTSRFDKRPRHRKTPSSFRLDATAAVKALADSGATEFHVNLVSFNLDGSPARDALKLDAVTLSFFD